MRQAIAILLSFILLVPLVAALSVSPSSTELNPSDPYPKTFEFNVINNEKAAVSIDVTVDGNLKGYITVNSYEKSIPVGGSSKISFIVNLPKNMQPGDYASKINVALKEVESGGVGVKLIVAHVVWFNLPYQGQHLKPNLIIKYHPDNNLEAVAQAISDGTESVKGANITLTIYSPDGRILGTYSEMRDVDVNSSSSVVGKVKVDEPAKGEYRAMMEVSYSGQKASAEGKITLAGEVQSTIGGEGTQGASASITGGQDNTLMYALIAVVLILAMYIIYSRRKK